MKVVLASVLVVLFVSGIQAQLKMVPQQCENTIVGCGSPIYSVMLKADTNCMDCCRRSGCDRGDCMGSSCNCVGCGYGK